MNATKIARIGRLDRLRRILVPSMGGLAAAALFGATIPNVATADDSTNAPATKAVTPPAAAKPDQKPAKTGKKVSGVELYAIHCNRCHPERYPVEFNEAQWKTLMLHMRVRANLPADQAQAILKYLQDEAGY